MTGNQLALITCGVQSSWAPVSSLLGLTTAEGSNITGVSFSNFPTSTCIIHFFQDACGASCAAACSCLASTTKIEVLASPSGPLCRRSYGWSTPARFGVLSSQRTLRRLKPTYGSFLEFPRSHDEHSISCV